MSGCRSGSSPAPPLTLCVGVWVCVCVGGICIIINVCTDTVRMCYHNYLLLVMLRLNFCYRYALYRGECTLAYHCC